MLTKIITAVKNCFKPKTYASELEAFIISKNPASGADIDHWTRVYDQRQTTWGKM
jgi:hypothetical protein